MQLMSLNKLLMKYGKTLAVLLLLISSLTSRSQSFDQVRDYLNRISLSGVDEAKISLNDSITYVLTKYLENDTVNNPWDYPDIPYLGELTSQDSMVKVFSWNIPLQNGTNIYNCIIYDRVRDKVIPLKNDEGLLDLEKDEVIGAGDWYGTLYYEIIKINEGDSLSYVLLGYCPANKLNSKVIEVLGFDQDGNVFFGKDVFADSPDDKKRMIFKYSPLATMMLKYQEESHRIVYDHLSPPSPEFTGQLRYYGPDFSYDALEIRSGRLFPVEDIDFRAKQDTTVIDN